MLRYAHILCITPTYAIDLFYDAALFEAPMSSCLGATMVKERTFGMFSRQYLITVELRWAKAKVMSVSLAPNSVTKSGKAVMSSSVGWQTSTSKRSTTASKLSRVGRTRSFGSDTGIHSSRTMIVRRLGRVTDRGISRWLGEGGRSGRPPARMVHLMSHLHTESAFRACSAL